MTIYQRGLIRGQGFAGFMRLSDQTLIDFGAIDTLAMVQSREYWRLVTATLLHGSLLHLLFNGFALFQLGRVIEDWCGSPMLVFLHLLLGFIGNVASVAYHMDRVRFLQVGASGALFGFLTFLAIGFWHERRREGTRVVWIMAFWIGFGLLSGVYVGADNAAHVGGAISGAIVGNFEFLFRYGTLPRLLTRSLGLFALFVYGSCFWAAVDAQHVDPRVRLAIEQRRLFREADHYLRLAFRAAEGPTEGEAPIDRAALSEELERVQHRLQSLGPSATPQHSAGLALVIQQVRAMLHPESDEAFYAPYNQALLRRQRVLYLSWANQIRSLFAPQSATPDLPHQMFPPARGAGPANGSP